MALASLWIPWRSDAPPENGSWRQELSYSKDGVATDGVTVMTGTGVPVGVVKGVDCALGDET